MLDHTDTCAHRVRYLMDELIDELNHADERDVAVAVAASARLAHRTLQQGLCRAVVLPLLREWAHQWETNNHDDRNTATCRLAHHLCGELNKPLGPNQPTIGWLPFI